MFVIGYVAVVVGVLSPIDVFPVVREIAYGKTPAGPYPRSLQLISRPVHPPHVPLEVAVRLFTLSPELVDMPGDGKIVNEVNVAPVVSECDHFHVIFTAYLHEFAILYPPFFTKEPVYLRCDDRLDNAVAYSPKHHKKCRTLIHPQLSGLTHVD